MGCDKALLSHPAGGTWLEQSLQLLLAVNLPVTVFSRHLRHLELTEHLTVQRSSERADWPGAPAAAGLNAIAEPPPWEGPLLALHRLMTHYPDQRLLLCPVDMPCLSRDAVLGLLRAGQANPEAIHLAHDGQRLQPLLGIYPSDGRQRTSLATAISGGERRLQAWLAGQAYREVRLDPEALRNVNRPMDSRAH
jgi:molybdopterin-guanine dinucleotide biosynthesis protein A